MTGVGARPETPGTVDQGGDLADQEDQEDRVAQAGDRRDRRRLPAGTPDPMSMKTRPAFAGRVFRYLAGSKCVVVLQLSELTVDQTAGTTPARL